MSPASSGVAFLKTAAWPQQGRRAWGRGLSQPLPVDVTGASGLGAWAQGVRPGGVASLSPLPVDVAGASGLRDGGRTSAQRPAPRRDAGAGRRWSLFFWPSLATDESGAFGHFVS